MDEKENKEEVLDNMTSTDETGFINTDELREILKDQEEKKVPWYKKIFQKKKKD